MEVANKEFENLTEDIGKDYLIRKQILWESKNSSESEPIAKENWIYLHTSGGEKVAI